MKKNDSFNESNYTLPCGNLLKIDYDSELKWLNDFFKKTRNMEARVPSVCAFTLHNTGTSILCADFLTESKLLFTGNKNSCIDIWNVGNNPLKQLRPSTELAACTFSENSEVEDILCDYPGDTARLVGHSGPVYKIKSFSQANTPFLLSGSQDSTAILWSLYAMSGIAKYRGHSQAIWDLDVSRIKPYFATASADKTARIWSTETTTSVRLLAGHFSDVEVVQFHPFSSFVLTGSSDKTCRLWDFYSGKTVRMLQGHIRGISSICFSPEGRYSFISDQTASIYVWDIQEGRRLRKIELKGAANDSIIDMCFASTGSVLCCASHGGFIFYIDSKKAVSSAVDDTELIIGSIKTKGTSIISLTNFNDNRLLATCTNMSEY